MVNLELFKMFTNSLLFISDFFNCQSLANIKFIATSLITSQNYNTSVLNLVLNTIDDGPLSLTLFGKGKRK